MWVISRVCLVYFLLLLFFSLRFSFFQSKWQRKSLISIRWVERVHLCPRYESSCRFDTNSWVALLFKYRNLLRNSFNKLIMTFTQRNASLWFSFRFEYINHKCLHLKSSHCWKHKAKCTWYACAAQITISCLTGGALCCARLYETNYIRSMRL